MGITRRAFLKGGVVIGGALLFDGIFVEPRFFKAEETVVKVAGLPRPFDGFKICQVTDIHHGMALDIAYVEQCVKAANALDPDVTVLTGDYVESNKKYFPEAVKRLAALRARHGVYAVLGNHDYYAGASHALKAFHEHDIPVLMNGHVVIEDNGSRLCVAGVREFIEDRADASAALRGAPADAPVVLLSHHPDYAELLPPDMRVDLVVSGHTHGGQIRLPFSRYAPVVPSMYGQKYTGGLVRSERGVQVYVSRGLGAAVIPVRFNCPPELTLLVLAPS
ncbi:MAG: metallophosphoesterase [Deltaproteobacteria bacterium]|nr:metallophosphoesterase [Deltaproteobacteria bacterium]